jgi:putative membrane protein insertion efficiency factor
MSYPMTAPEPPRLSFARRALLATIHFYRAALSPLIGPACRFEPTCSVYAEQAITRFGFGKGILLTLHRILRCHPFARGGLDPLPSHDGKTLRAKST